MCHYNSHVSTLFNDANQQQEVLVRGMERYL